MNLFELLTNFGTKKNNNEQLKLNPIQLNENGDRDDLASLQMKNAQEPLTLGERLIGRTLEQDKQTINPETGETKLETVKAYRPGLLNDISSGYQENRFTPVKLDNFTQNTVNGRPKGFAYRLGEGLGSLTKFAESPLGRSLLVGGIVGATGGSGLEALAYGSKAGVLNQQNRMQDAAYRNQLRNFGQMSDDEINSIRGYIDNDTYKNLLQAQQYKDSADWKKMYFQANQDNLQAQREWQKQQAEIQKAEKQADREYQRQKDDADRAVKVRGQNLDYELGKNKLKQDNGGKLSSGELAAHRDNLATLKDIEAGLELIEKNPKAYSLVKGTLPAWATNRLDPQGIATRTQIDNITAVYRKWLTGAQMSDAERKSYERFLPAPTDNYETIKAKLQGMRDSIKRKDAILFPQGEVVNLNGYDNDPLGLGI